MLPTAWDFVPWATLFAVGAYLLRLFVEADRTASRPRLRRVLGAIAIVGSVANVITVLRTANPIL